MTLGRYRLKRALKLALCSARLCKFQVFLELAPSKGHVTQFLSKFGYGTVCVPPDACSTVGLICGWLSSGIVLGVWIQLTNTNFRSYSHTLDPDSNLVPATQNIIAVVNACSRVNVPCALEFSPAFHQHSLFDNFPEPTSQLLDNMCQYGVAAVAPIRTFWYGLNPDLIGRVCRGREFRCNIGNRIHIRIQHRHVFRYRSVFYQLCAKSLSNAIQNLAIANLVRSSFL